MRGGGGGWTGSDTAPWRQGRRWAGRHEPLHIILPQDDPDYISLPSLLSLLPITIASLHCLWHSLPYPSVSVSHFRRMLCVPDSLRLCLPIVSLTYLPAYCIDTCGFVHTRAAFYVCCCNALTIIRRAHHLPPIPTSLLLPTLLPLSCLLPPSRLPNNLFAAFISSLCVVPAALGGLVGRSVAYATFSRFALACHAVRFLAMPAPDFCCAPCRIFCIYRAPAFISLTLLDGP